MSKWTRHRDKWKNCKLCELCKTRNRVVLLRGKIPCDILFIGEAPGTGENSLGRPFVGPAGKLLDTMISDAGLDSFRLAFTNLVACIPIDDGNKGEPQQEHIEACGDRLREIYQITKPDAVVRVGKLATKWVLKAIDMSRLTSTTQHVSIIHPAAILRADVTQKGLAIQQTVVRLRNLAEEAVPF
jgi:DNA polymerase